jgi:SAM-dependent methyltransferase
MKIITNLRNWLYEPLVHGVAVDDNALLAIHMEVLRKKPLLRSAFETFYRNMMGLCDRFLVSSGMEIELGSGAGFFKSMRPNLLTSDIRKDPHIDLELDAQRMHLNESSVRCIYAINVFHHLPDPDRFFSELCRVLVPGGGCILVEPHIGFSSALLHKHLHSDENFLPDVKSWKTTDIAGPLSGANQAMAYIVFERDIERFNSLYGEILEICYQGYVLNALRYLLSGGLNFRQLLPSVFEPMLRAIEVATKPFAHYLSLHQVIVIRKRA